MSPPGRAPRPLSLETARRLAVVRQGLAARPLPARSRRGAVRPDELVGLVERLGYVQLDPISVVERSPLLVLWSRLGPFDAALLDEAQFERRSLFEYWSHAASIVPTAHLPIHRPRMRTRWTGESTWDLRVRRFLEANASLQATILERLRAEGPLPAQAFAGPAPARWRSGGWNDGRDVDRLLDFLWLRGVVCVAGRQGGRRTWELAERWWPEWAPQEELGEEEVMRRRLAGEIRAMGAATLRQATRAHSAARRAEFAATAAAMLARGELVPVEVQAGGGRRGSAPLPGSWLLHAADLPLVEEIERGAFRGRTVLLSPFDNLLIDRERAEALFGFEYRMEIYVPKAKRRFGYYALPLLHRDRLVGKVDAAADRRAGTLRVLSVHAERRAPRSTPLAAAIEQLARCCGLPGWDAGGVSFGPEVPVSWKAQLA